MRTPILSILALCLLLSACLPPDQPRHNPDSDAVLNQLTSILNRDSLGYKDTVYIPIYSDIYSETKAVKFNLTATLSIRNTSLYDTLYLDGIDYYDSAGDLVRAYLDTDQTLALNPMQSIEYVIEENDVAGGTGANFIIQWAATSDQIKPVFQGVMISTNGQQGISFLTEGVSISRR